MLFINSERPEAVGLPNIAEHSNYVEIDEKGAQTSQSIASLPLLTVFVENILKNKIVWAVTLTSMSIYVVRYGVMSWIPSYLPTKGFDESWAKWLVGIFELSAVPGVIALGYLSDLFKGRRAVGCLACAIGLVLCLMVYFGSSNHMAITVALFIMGTLIYAPLSLVGLMVNEAVPNYALGLSTGFMGFFQYVFGETIATALIGKLVGSYGWVASEVTIYIAAAAAILLLIYLVFKEQRILRAEARLNHLPIP